jgi:hypothetical protein
VNRYVFDADAGSSASKNEVEFQTEVLVVKSKRIALMMASLTLLVGGAPAFAHHAPVAEFDMDKDVTLRGVISKVEWINPHVYIYIDVKDDKGNVTTWALESLPTRFFHNMGLTKAMLGEGQAVTIVAKPAKIPGKPLAWISRITYPDGHAYDFGK